MKNNYVTPCIKLHEIKNDRQLLAGSETDETYKLGSSPTKGLGKNGRPTNGGASDGTQEVGAKNNSFSVWSDDE